MTRLEILNEEDIQRIHEATLDILESTGTWFNHSEEAIKLFLEVQEINPEDLAAALYIQRCQKFIELGFPDDWDGIERFY